MNKKVLRLRGIILGLVFLVLLMGLFQYFGIKNLPEKSIKTFLFFYMFVMLIFIIAAWMILREITRLMYVEEEAKADRACLEETRELVAIMRTQRHDFINHLQVICGLIQLKRENMVSNYINRVCDDLKNTSCVCRLSKPEVAALFLRKVKQAESLQIKLVLEVDSNLEYLALPGVDLQRILGNLIDNAIQAVDALEEKWKKVAVYVFEEDCEYVFKIWNRYPVISPELHNKIFERGFSTKGTKGEGLGLYIVKTLISKNKGSINLISNEEEGTSFIVRFSSNSGNKKVS